MPSNVLHLHIKQILLCIIWIFTEKEGDEIKSRLTFKIYSTVIIPIQINTIISKLGQAEEHSGGAVVPQMGGETGSSRVDESGTAVSSEATTSHQVSFWFQLYNSIKIHFDF